MKKILNVLLILVIFVIVIGLLAFPHLKRKDYVVTVTSLQVKRPGLKKKEIYLVFTKLDSVTVKVFKNTDSWIEFKWNSSDIQAKLEPNKKYKLRIYGWRIPFLSKYENIVDVTPLSDK
jgi:hypothetical protein